MTYLKIKKADGSWDIIGGNPVELDDTLTQSDFAADAKAVGDAIVEVKNSTVSYAEIQDLTENEKFQARSNLGVYAQDNEPVDAEIGTLWIDTSSEGSLGGGGSSVSIDTTLTQAGMAADAKAVGDKFAEVNETVEGLATKEYVNEKVESASGLPDTNFPHQQLVTDGNGEAKWEERTHYVEQIEGSILNEKTLTVNEDNGVAILTEPFVSQISPDAVYKITYNGIEYTCIGTLLTQEDGTEAMALGNLSVVGIDNGSDAPFLIMSLLTEELILEMGYYAMIIPLDGSMAITISITGNIDLIHTIDEKYLPSSNSFIKNGKALGSLRAVLSYEEDDDYHLGEGAFSEGISTRAIGNYSHAEGSSSVAEGDCSHAENYGKSYGVASHAEGAGTTHNEWSHAEGGGTAYGKASHAENYGNSYGVASHAEGDGYAYGDYSHAEGISSGHISLRISGEANAITYSYQIDNYGNAPGFYYGGIICYRNNFAKIIDINTSNNTITLSQTLSSEPITSAIATFHNRIANGIASHTEGSKTSAYGDYSHAEGFNTFALSESSHAEGYHRAALGKYSHAEGDTAYLHHISEVSLTGEANSTSYNCSLGYERAKKLVGLFVYWNETIAEILEVLIAEDESDSILVLSKTLSDQDFNEQIVILLSGALGDASHAEGQNTNASGLASHAEGQNTNASGNLSHAEGDETNASGIASHAEGYGTIAAGLAQHVQGKFNIKDLENKYAHIVGNGSLSDRSNAHTLDWDGNAWFSGDVYVGSTSGVNKDEGSKKLATEEYVNIAVNNGGGSDNSNITVNGIAPDANGNIETYLCVTVSGPDDQGTIIADKTFSEILTAYEEKKIIYCYSEVLNSLLPLVGIHSDDSAVFGLTLQGLSIMVIIYPDNTCNIIENQLTGSSLTLQQQNLSGETVQSITYDGSEEQTFTVEVPTPDELYGIINQVGLPWDTITNKPTTIPSPAKQHIVIPFTEYEISDESQTERYIHFDNYNPNTGLKKYSFFLNGVEYESLVYYKTINDISFYYIGNSLLIGDDQPSNGELPFLVVMPEDISKTMTVILSPNLPAGTYSFYMTQEKQPIKYLSDEYLDCLQEEEKETIFHSKVDRFEEEIEGIFLGIFEFDNALEVGKQYELIFNGRIFQGQCEKISIIENDSDSTFLTIGNNGLGNPGVFTDTGEDFLFVNQDNMFMCYVRTPEPPSSAFVSLSKLNYKLKDSYLSDEILEGKNLLTENTINLLNPDTCTNDYIIEKNGPVATANYSCSDYIEVDGSKAYSFRGKFGGGVQIVLYDADKNYIWQYYDGQTTSGSYATGYMVLNLSETYPNTRYVRVNMATAAIGSVYMIVEGSEYPAEYIPFVKKQFKNEDIKEVINEMISDSQMLQVGEEVVIADTAQQSISIGNEAGGGQGNAAIAIGTGALKYLADNDGTDNGRFNTAIGHQAMRDASTADHSTAIGYQAMRGCTTGDYNTAVGEDAAMVIGAGSRNVAVGCRAMQSQTAGDDNVAVGAMARYFDMANKPTGSRNTAVGARAGDAGGAGSDCVHIGYGAKNFTAGLNNTIVIGSNVKATKENQTVIGNDSTVETIIRGNVLVKNSDDSSEKQVVATAPVEATDAGKFLQVQADGSWGAVELDGIVLKSENKKFRLTINDEGVLSATEIV